MSGVRKYMVRLVAVFGLNPILLWLLWNHFAGRLLDIPRITLFWDAYLLQLFVGAVLFPISGQLGMIRADIEEKREE